MVELHTFSKKKYRLCEIDRSDVRSSLSTFIELLICNGIEFLSK